ncbi:MAG: hypothetical protein NPIRA03_22310 [Nitrospirales bacterium]|nr:MAG: hypothetical protein NPIRA03_22310 [Nitrospirales bacterium]
MSGKTFLAPKKRKRKTGGPSSPRFVPGLGDLVDRLTVDQLKEAFHESIRTSVRTEIADLEHDIDGWADRHQIKLSGRNVRIIIVLAQINYEIWMCKERMKAEPKLYDQWLKRAHQLNGIRNQMKNLLLARVRNATRVCRASNVSVDDLDDWSIQL